MNIYIHLEISSRELDSKLLLGILAASRGHHVIVSDQESIIKGLRRKILAPGIFHTKSVTPSETKITKHNKIIETGSKITSIDEEGGLIDHGYDYFAKLRYNEQSIEQSSAIFAWGPEDAQTLKKTYPHYSQKIHMTGSPRADLWQPYFASYWKNNNKEFNKPFLLVSSNMGVLNMKPFHETYKFLKERGTFERDPKFLKNSFAKMGEEYQMVYYFFKAIKYLANNNNRYNIILRPHPTENIEIWKSFLEDVQNVKVIREDSISSWLNNAFAIMHNSCTTALEATLSRKPVITYIPFQGNYARELANDLGHRVETLEELSDTIKHILDKINSQNQKNTHEPLPKVIVKKIYIDENEHAANKMIKVWESLNSEKLSITNNWIKFKFKLKIMKFNGMIGRIYRSVFKKKFKEKENYKFPPLNEEKIIEKVNRLQKILGIEEKIDCKLLSDRTILIKLR